jgi:DNA-binding transcriptional LysR family regulator
MHSNAVFGVNSYLFGIMIDIRQMRYFVVLAETLHFGRAAERLHLTQPPLSRQIIALEKELGARLLERHSRHIRLTRAGERFLDDSKAVLTLFDQACRNARLAELGEIGEITLGFMMHAAHTIVPGLARRFMAAFPHVELRLRETVPNKLVEDLIAGRLDIGIMFPPNPVQGLEIRPIYREKLCVALNRTHALCDRDVIRRADLGGQPLIMTPEEIAPALRALIMQYCRTGGFLPTVRIEAQLQQTIVSLVAEGLGIALVPESMSKVGGADVVFRELEDAPAVDHVIVWRSSSFNPALRRFLATASVDPVT